MESPILSDRVNALKNLLLASKLVSEKSILVEVELNYAWGYRDRYYEELVNLYIKDVTTNEKTVIKTFKLMGKRSTEELVYKLYYKTPPHCQRYGGYKLKILIPYHDLRLKTIKAKVRRVDLFSNDEEFFERDCEYKIVKKSFILDSPTLNDHVALIVGYIIDYAKANNLPKEFFNKLIKELEKIK